MSIPISIECKNEIAVNYVNVVTQFPHLLQLRYSYY